MDLLGLLGPLLNHLNYPNPIRLVGFGFLTALLLFSFTLLLISLLSLLIKPKLKKLQEYAQHHLNL